jgi:hypothetical protein
MPLSDLRDAKEVDLTAEYASWEPAKLALWMAIHASATRKGVLLGEPWEVEEAIDNELEAWSNEIEKELKAFSKDFGAHLNQFQYPKETPQPYNE